MQYCIKQQLLTIFINEQLPSTLVLTNMHHQKVVSDFAYCVCMRACVRACVRACLRVCVCELKREKMIARARACECIYNNIFNVSGNISCVLSFHFFLVLN